ncbi:terminase [Corynebacterium sp.]|uniref:terminase n=1 Tax=Corynebacterium sp. TaxID=1720 RepID=UPI0028B253CE|nr:terminase [Corynebacterium sp.]
MTDSQTSSLPPGYYEGPHGAWCTLPWPDDPDEKAALMESSLGPQVIRWAEWDLYDRGLDGPGLLNDNGERWKFTRGQARFLILWYAFDERGRFIFRRGAKRGSKGTGKDPFGAAMCNIEFLGPSQLYWDGERYAGKRHEMPLVQVASNSLEQSKDMFRVANSQWGVEATDFYGIDKGLVSTRLKDSAGLMEVLTASERSAEGDPATFIALNETHHMTESSGGVHVAAVARRNVGKSKAELQARMVDFTNAHVQGGESVGERTFRAWQKQVSGASIGSKQDILYDSIEADPRLDFYEESERKVALRQAYSDAPWADLERLGDEIADPELSAADAIRFYLNGLATAEDAFVDPSRFAALADPSKKLRDGDRIALFLDCSKSEDATAMMACRIDDGFNQVMGVWERPRGPRGEGYLVNRDDVDRVVRDCMDRYRVVWFGVDPSPAKDDSKEASYWKPMVDRWHLDFQRRLKVWATLGPKGSSVMFDMRTSTSGAVDRNRKICTETEIIQELVDEQGLDGSFRHDGNADLVRHVNNTRCRWGKFGLTPGKANRDSPMLVDLCVAMIGANVGRREALNSGKVRLKGKRSGNGPRMMILK